MHRRERLPVVDGPPVGADPPGSEADLGDLPAGLAEPSRVHHAALSLAELPRRRRRRTFNYLSKRTILLAVSKDMPSLARHELSHADGRRLLVYGDALRKPRRRACERTSRRRSTSGSTSSPATGSGSRRHGTRDRSTRPRRPPRRARSAPAERRSPSRTRRPSSTTGFPSFRPDPTAAPGASTGRPARQRGRCEVVLYTHRHETSFGGPLAHRARPCPRSLDRPDTRAVERSRPCVRLRLREPRRRGRRDDRAPARADLRARPRPADHRCEGGGTPRSPGARRAAASRAR